VDLLDRPWARCFADLDVAEPPASELAEIRARYSEPHRAYHTLQHLDDCLIWFHHARALAQRPGEVAMALFYHDAVYDTHARDSEERSAALAAAALEEHCRADPDTVERVRALVLATKHDAAPDSDDARLLVDIDLAILGAASARFDEYERQVRLEYSWVAPEDFRKGRGDILRHFPARETIYATEFFRTRFESAARANHARSLASLA